jgi:hypothetical protein
MEFRYLPDKFIETEDKDLLNFKEFAGSTLAAIKKSEPPFTWGIYGDWGSGKTSLMKLIRNRMVNDLEAPETAPSGPLHIPIWFDAWKYENEVNIIYPLFDAIRRDFSVRCTADSKNKEFLASFKRVALGSLLGLTDLALRTVTKAAIGEALKLDDVKKSLETVEEDLGSVFGEWTNQVADTTEAFEDFVKQYLVVYGNTHPECQQRQLYLAVFIDDLDRCLPEVAIEILERIKNHLTTEKCIFILGINRSIVYKSIRKKYGDLDIDGRQHLEKIIQYSVGVPKPSEKAIKEFGIRSLQELVGADDKSTIEKYFDEFSQAIFESGFTNPRKIKRILNRYLNFIAKHVEGDSDIAQFKIPTVVRLIVMREYYQGFYDLFREEGFPAFELIRDYTGKDRKDRFVSKYGEKWEGLIAQMDRMREFAKLEQGPKTAMKYCEAIDELFGLED